MKGSKELEFCIKVDEHVISELHSKITQENIIATVQNIKEQLLSFNLDKEKIFNVYDISIEMLQNILKYSYGNKIYENKKREADGRFMVSYNSTTQDITICSCNLITSLQKNIIKQRVDEVKNLSEKELRKLLRSKMKSRKDNHEDGAGLGFTTIATKISKPIKVQFEEVLKDIMKYRLEVVI